MLVFDQNKDLLLLLYNFWAAQSFNLVLNDFMLAVPVVRNNPGIVECTITLHTVLNNCIHSPYVSV